MNQHTVNSAICCKCACLETWQAVLLSVLAQECRNSTYLTHYNWCEPICQDGWELRFDLLAKVVSFGDPRDEPVRCIFDLRLVPQGCWRYRPQLRGAAHHNFLLPLLGYFWVGNIMMSLKCLKNLWLNLFSFFQISLISLKGLSTWVIAHSLGWIFCWDCSTKLPGVSMDLQQMRGRGLLHRVYLSEQKDHTGTSQRQGTVVSTKIFRLLRFRKRTFHRWFVIWLGWVWGPFSVCTYASDTGQRVSFFFLLVTQVRSLSIWPANIPVRRHVQWDFIPIAAVKWARSPRTSFSLKPKHWLQWLL